RGQPTPRPASRRSAALEGPRPPRRCRTSRTPATASTSTSFEMERWSAHGNVYLVIEERLDAARVRAEVGDADGIVEIVARGDDWADVVIWNPDGSTAEMSGNATRIAAAWLSAERSTVRVAGREVHARKLRDGRI